MMVLMKGCHALRANAGEVDRSKMPCIWGGIWGGVSGATEKTVAHYGRGGKIRTCDPLVPNPELQIMEALVLLTRN
jgi:hypothetical protein